MNDMPCPDMMNMPDHYPRPHTRDGEADDQVEVWLKRRRDEIRLRTPLGVEMKGFREVNQLLDEYREAAAQGISLCELVNGPQEAPKTTRKKKAPKPKQTEE